jgi:large subunit ribosomal protein L4
MLRTAPINPTKAALALLPPFTTLTAHAFPSLLPAERFDLKTSFLQSPMRKDILHRAIVFERDAMRQGSASTKSRSDMTYSTKKLRPQKGSGAARLGDRSSPMLRGGARAHGPKPRDFSTELPKKVYHLAIRTALSHLYREGKLTVVQGQMELPTHKTQTAVAFLEAHGFAQASTKQAIGGRTLFITNKGRTNLERATANVGYLCEVLRLDEMLLWELLKYNRILIERKALTELELMTRVNDQ